MTARAHPPQVDAYIDRLPDWGRSIQVYRDDAIDKDAITAILREIVEYDRQGGWRRLAR